MKFCNSLVFSILGSFLCSAQEPPIVGAWQVGNQSFEYLGSASSRDASKIEATVEPIEFLAGGTVSDDGDSGTWLFSDDYLLVAAPGRLETFAVSVTGDSFVYARDERVEVQGGFFIKEVDFNIGVKSPSAPFVASEVEGDWVIFQRKVKSEDLTIVGITSKSLSEVSQSRINVTLAAEDLFTIQIVTDTSAPEDEGISGFGSWIMDAGALETTFLGEVSVRSHFSSGGDLLVVTEDEVDSSGGAIEEFSSQIEVWIKKPAILTMGDVVGRWGIAGTTIDVSTGSGNQTLDEVGFEESVLEFRADGTGTIRVVDSGDPGSPGRVNSFVWELDGVEMVLSNTEGSFQFVISAEKDFALMQKFEVDLVNESESFDFFAMAKLPNVPGFAETASGIGLVEDVNGGRKAVLTTPTMTGLRYQVEMGETLTGWQGSGPIMEGTGGVITSDLPALSGGGFFRWRILPPEDE